MKLLNACDIDCLLLHDFFNNILSHYIEKKIKLLFKLIEMDNSCSFPLFPSARQSICIYMWCHYFWTVQGRVKPGLKTVIHQSTTHPSVRAW